MSEPRGVDRRRQPVPPFAGPLDRTFQISLIVKGLDGLLEVLGGVALFFVSPDSINRIVRWATAHELAQDPGDFIARHLLHSASQLSHGSTVYGAVYLLAHGVSKVVLVVLLLREKLWAYPWMMALLMAFIVYQVYRFIYRPSISLVVLSVFDVFVIWLTWREYRTKRQAHTDWSRGGGPHAEPAAGAT